MADSLDIVRAEIRAGDSALNSAVDNIINELNTLHSKDSTEVLHRSEGDLVIQRILEKYIQDLLDGKADELNRYLDFQSTQNLGMEELRTFLLGVQSEITGALGNLTSTLVSNLEMNDLRFDKVQSDLQRYLTLLSDITLDSNQITLDNGELRYGAWTILSQARQWDLDIINRLNGIQNGLDGSLDEALEELQNSIPSTEEIISKAIEELSNAPGIKELSDILNQSVNDVVQLQRDLAAEAWERAEQARELAEQLRDEALARAESLRTEFLAQTDLMIADIHKETSARIESINKEVADRTAALDALVIEVNDNIDTLVGDLTTSVNAQFDGIASDMAALNTSITEAKDGLTQEIQYRKDGDTANLNALNTYKVSNDGAVSGIQTSLNANVTKTNANATAISGLTSSLTTTNAEVATVKTSAANAMTKAQTAVDANSALSTRVDALYAAITDSEGTTVDVTAFNALKAEVSTINGTVNTLVSDTTALKSNYTDLNDRVSANTTASNALTTRMTAAEGSISAHNSDITLLRSDVNTFSAGLATKASNEAVNALTSDLSIAKGNITNQASDITRLKTSLNSTSALSVWSGTSDTVLGMNVNQPTKVSLVADVSTQSGSYIKVGENSGNDYVTMMADHFVNIDPNKLYRMRMRYRRMLGSSGIYIGLMCANADKTKGITASNTEIPIVSISSALYVVSNAKPANTSWNIVEYYFKGRSAGASTGAGTKGSPRTFPALASYTRLMALVGYNTGAGEFDIDYIIFEDAEHVEMNDANASAVQSLTATVTEQGGVLSTHTNSLTALTSSINTINNALSTKADSSALSNYYTKTENNSVIAGNINSFNASLVIGGDNLLPGTKAGGFDPYLTATVTESQGEFRTSTFKFTKTAVNPGGIHSTVDNRRMVMKAGVTYTLTFKARGTALPSYLYFMGAAASGSNLAITNRVLTGFNEDTFVEMTATAKAVVDTQVAYLLIANTGSASGTWCEIAEVMVQEGTKATTWSLSPLDLENSINSNATAIQTTQADVVTVDGKTTANSNAITTLQGKMTVVEGGLLSKADASALSNLDSKVATIDGKVTSQASSILQLRSDLTTTDAKAGTALTNAATAQQTANTAVTATQVNASNIVSLNSEMVIRDQDNLAIPFANITYTGNAYLQAEATLREPLTLVEGDVYTIKGKVSFEHPNVLTSNQGLGIYLDGSPRFTDIAVIKQGNDQYFEGVLTVAATNAGRVVNYVRAYLLPNGTAVADTKTTLHWVELRKGDQRAVVDTTKYATVSALQILDTRVTDVDGKVTSNSNSITSLNSRMTITEGSLTSKADASALTALTTRVTNAEGVNTSQGTRVTNIENKVNSSVNGLDTKVAQASFDTLNSKVTNSSTGLEAVNSKTTLLETNVNYLNKTKDYVVSNYRNGTALPGSKSRGIHDAEKHLIVHTRGFNLTLINADGTLGSNTAFDLAGGFAAAALAMRTALESLTTTQFFILTGQDHIGTFGTNTDANAVECRNLLVTCGVPAALVSKFVINTLPVIVGRKGIAQGAAFIQVLDTTVDSQWMDTPVTFVNGRPVGVGGSTGDKLELGVTTKVLEDLSSVVNHSTTGLAVTNSKVVSLESTVNSTVNGLPSKVSTTAFDTIANKVNNTSTGLDAVNSKTTLLETTIGSIRDSDSLLPDYMLANPNAWVSHYGYSMGQYFKTVSEAKVGTTVFRKDATHAVNCWNYSTSYLPNTRKYRLSAWIRRSTDSTGACYFTVRLKDGAGVNYGYSSNAITTKVPATGIWTLVTVDWDVTSTADAKMLAFGFALGHTGSAGWSELQGFKVEAILDPTELTVPVATVSALDNLNTKVTQEAAKLVTESSKITALENKVNDPTTGVAALSTGLNELKSTVNNSSTGVVATSQQLTSLKSSVDGMTIGGTNLLMGTKDASCFSSYNSYGSISLSDDVTVKTKVVRSTVGTVNQTSGIVGNVGTRPKLIANKQYVLSYLVRGNTYPTYLYMMGASATGSNMPITAKPVTGFNADTFIKVEVLFTSLRTTQTAYPLIAIIGSNSVSGGWFEVAECMLQEGNTATAWSDSYADVPQIDESKFAQAEAFDTLKTYVGNENLGGATSLASKVTALTSTVGNNTNALTVQANVLNGIKSQYHVKMETNGVIGGFGLLQTSGAMGTVVTSFGVSADNFFIGAPASNKKPFIVTTSTTTVNGVSYPAGTWIDTALIANATIGTAHIADASITNAKIKELDASKITTGTLDAKRIRVGSTTQFDTGYAPTDVLNDAKSYVDGNTGNLVNNPSVSGNKSRWTNGTVTNQNFLGTTIPVLTITTTGDLQVTSDDIDVDPSKAYEVSVWVKKSAAVGSTYLGLNIKNAAGTNIGINSVNQSGGTSLNTNFYHWNVSAEANPLDWIKLVAYVMPAGTNPLDMKQVGSVTSNGFMLPNTRKLQMRVLNYYNSGTSSTAWFANPKVVEVDPNAVIAAAKAQILADSKTQTFTAQPVPPYTAGDLWRNGATIRVCTVTRASGSYVAADWTLVGDVTSANTAANANQLGGKASATVLSDITSAKSAADAAASKATAADTQLTLWKYPNTTEIDGGKIRANTITANQIDASVFRSVGADGSTSIISGGTISAYYPNGNIAFHIGVS